MGGSRLGRVRGALSSRTRKEKVVGVATVALIASAPFGGLDRAGEEPPQGFRLHKAVTIGPYDVTFLRAYRVAEFVGEDVPEWAAMTVRPSTKSRRLLIVEVDVANDGKRPEYAHVLTRAVSVGGAAKTDGHAGPTADPTLISRADASRVSSLNPGLTHRLALVVEQSARTRTPRTNVAIAELMYVGKGGLASNLDEYYWLQHDETARRGAIPVGDPPASDR